MKTALEELGEIKGKMDLREFVMDDLGVHERLGYGDYVQVACPFHEDRTPSLAVYESRFKCFGCDARGDIADYLQMRYGYTTISAVLIHLRGGKDHPTIAAGRRKSHKPAIRSVGKARLLSAASEITSAAFGRFDDSSAYWYCHRRGWSERVWRRYHLGYLPHGSVTLFDDRAALAELGVLTVDGSACWLDDRMVIPIHSPGFEIVALASRTLPPNDKGVRYVNSRRTPIFHRDEMLYGEAQISEEPMGNALFVVEGYADVWSLAEKQIDAVAVMGDHLTEPQAESLAMRVLRDGIQIVLAFDGDTEGKRGEENAAAALLRRGVEPLRMNLPSGDMDDAAMGRDLAGTEALFSMTATLTGRMRKCLADTFDTTRAMS